MFIYKINQKYNLSFKFHSYYLEVINSDNKNKFAILNLPINYYSTTKAIDLENFSDVKLENNSSKILLNTNSKKIKIYSYSNFLLYQRIVFFLILIFLAYKQSVYIFKKCF